MISAPQKYTSVARIAAKRRRWTVAQPQLEAACSVYFIEAVGLDLIKIGYASDVGRRFRALQAGSAAPLKLLGTMRGGPQAECALHDKLAEHRSHGEWFRKCALIEDLIQVLTSTPFRSHHI